MSVQEDMNVRRARYKQMSTPELLELHEAGILDNTTYDVLESELGERGATIPARPNGGKTRGSVGALDLRKYKTFWRRVGAAFLDMGALAPISWIDRVMWGNVKIPFILAMWLIVSTFIVTVYQIALHGLYGQTLGKFVLQVKVVNKSEEPLLMRQAIYRDAAPILLFLPVSVYQIGNIMKGYIAEEGLGTFPHVWSFAIIGLSWFLLELITMLTNKKRRAVHDYIAGSVVLTCLSEVTPLARKITLSRRWVFVILVGMFVINQYIICFAR